MANNSLNLTSLDFDTLKANLKTFLSTQSVFKDYNFEGSNINVLLDVLSYNSYLNSFYLNMVASEMFLDSAQKMDSVVSHAKELNYIRRSHQSASANVNLTIATSGVSNPLTIPKGTSFTGINSNGSFTFVTDQEHTYTSSNSTYSITDLKLYEGIYIKNSFIMDRTNEAQRFVLPNENIDINSLTVVVSENGTNAEFFKVDTLFGLSSTSNVYFVQAAQNDEYEVLFGDGFLGRKPINQSLITTEYRVVNGSDADGINSFVIDTDLGVPNSGVITVEEVEVSANSSGGANSEHIESVRFSAPRYFATQQRAVATDDYASLILAKFGGNISDVNVYGGQDLTPKQYGKVAVCLKSSGSTTTPDYIKTQISQYLLKYVSIPTRIVLTDPDYIYCGVTTTVQYNKNITTKYPNDIKSLVRAAIRNYSIDNLEQFEGDFRYSRFVNVIDDSDSSITSNDTRIELIKKISPKINALYFEVLDFNNELFQADNEITVISSAFTYRDADGNDFTFSYIKDNGNGIIIVFNYVNGIESIINSNVGTVDYENGIISISGLRVSDYTTNILVHAIPLEKDIIISKNKILIIDPNDVSISITEKRE